MDATPIQFLLPSRPEYCDVIRLTTAGIARKIKFSDEAIDDLKAAVGEACLNVIRHAYPTDPQNISLTYRPGPDCLEILIEDTGEGFEVEDMMKKSAKFDPDNPKTSGYGLMIMQSLMDEVEISSQKGVGSKVRLLKRL